MRPDRFDTATAVSKKYSARVTAVFVAAPGELLDALPAAAAAHLGGPLLLTPASSMPAKVLAEIKRLKRKQIFITDGSAAVSDSVRRSFAAIASVQRLGGPSRYETGQRVIERAYSSAEQALIATGRASPTHWPPPRPPGCSRRRSCALTATRPQPGQARRARLRSLLQGQVATDLMLYGPVGATAAAVTVDSNRENHRCLPNLGRPTVTAPVYDPRPGAQGRGRLQRRGRRV
ncbi:cell wall-binding repeat-containing protein [Microbacterium sp. NPDC058345]|uniref:cell wall-binding repeat-containing protein n=1 Tax=Microbacterium sp. NPDC058345 TaxID=3346455 RepID=UPI003648A07A